MDFLLGFLLGAALFFIIIANRISEKPARVIMKTELGPDNMEMHITFRGIDSEEAKIICDSLPVVYDDEEKVKLH